MLLLIRNLLPPLFFEPEFLDLAAVVRARTTPGDRLFSLNTWDHLYPLTGTLPATRPLVPHLPWYMNQPNIQETITQQLQDSPPQLVVTRDYDPAGLGAYSPRIIDSYLNRNFRITQHINSYKILQPIK